ncbi:MAG: DUF5060 domain-containing protein [Bacteroidota bacterium]|nr:DUF5060 domain-containing protein [Odoribacter sp.]MDP3644692.1 DUF5060 domain-containing protein [Bacteroidota bacterium]
MKKLSQLFILSFFLITNLFAQTPTIQGELKKWHTIRLLFDGPQCSETNFKPNPFLDFRLQVTFTNGSKTYQVPGFFSADGESGETGAMSGNKWQVNFVPDEVGVWKYQVSFRTGKDISISIQPDEGTSLPPNGSSGTFAVTGTDKNARGFLSKGRLEYVGERYLKFRETGQYFLKNGADSPENFLAYSDFNQTNRYGTKAVVREGEANPKESCHKYEPHLKDWHEGEPTWQVGKGKGIIGALNYLASQGVNSQYMLTMNIQGDGKDVWPYSDHNERTRFDCSKLDQWETVFSHMERLGIMLHFVLQETENECLLDGGQTDVQRKVYLRELVARFGHHLAVTWNLGEENGPADWTPVGQTDRMRKDMANYLKSINPYPNFVVVHTHSDVQHQDMVLNPLLGFENLEGPSMQIGKIEDINNRVAHFITESAKTKKPWVVNLDEIGPAHKGVMPDEFDAQHDTVRHYALWGSLMAGAAGAEWYFGYRYPHNDLMCEDFRSRELWWKQTKIATNFFQNNLPFAQMKPANELVSPATAWCLAKSGEVYAVYLPKAEPGEITLPAGKYLVKWFNPRTDGKLLDGSVKTLNGGKVSLGAPPAEPEKDWVVLITKAK